MINRTIEKNALFSIGSDSHYHTTIGELENAEMLVKKFKINRNNILNYDKERLFNHLNRNKVKIVTIS